MNIRKTILILFVIFHLVTIFSQGFWSTFDVYYDVYYKKPFSIPYLNWTRPTEAFPLYYTLTGTDTGYGVFGKSASSVKYLEVSFLDDQGKVIAKDRTHGLTTRNGLSRFRDYASHLANYISDTEDLEKKAVTDTAYLNFVNYRKNYTEKSFKWVGLNSSRNIEGCSSYNVKLYSIIPENIWDKNNKNQKPEIYVLQSYDFPVVDKSK